MNKLVLLFFFFTGIVNAAIDVSFNGNSWVTDAGGSIANGELTLTGSASNYYRATLVKTVDPSIKNLYFVAEVYMTTIAGGPESYKWPKFKIYNNTSGANVLAYNLDENIEGKWVTTGMVVENFDKKGVSEIRLEFGFQNATGTMKIRNPQLLDSPPSSTYSFPFDVPADPSCSIQITTSETHQFENDLLSANSHFSWASYDWGTAEVINLINQNFPMSTMRFPGGTVGNFYAYATDGYYGDAYTFINKSRENAYNAGFTFNYSGYKNLCLANNASSVLMFNVVQDDVNTAKSRLQSRISDGVNVSWIEMGNENFFAEQGLGNVNSLANYINHTTALSAGLKAVDPAVKVAVNIEHDNYQVGSWNSELSQLNYFDAAVMHPYVNTNTFMLNDFSANVMFSAFKTTAHRIQEYKTNFGNTPLLFTEWSILSSGTPMNFVQTLSLADMFLAIEKGNQDGVVQQAGIHMLYHSDTYGEATMAYHDGSNIVLTANGVMYATLFDVFKGKTVYDAVSSSAELSTGLPAVNAKAVLDGDSIRVYVVNKLPISAPLNITVDGTAQSSGYVMKSFSEDPSQVLTVPYANKTAPWTQTTGVGSPSVPAYSIAVVSFKKSDLVTSLDVPFEKGHLKVYPNPTTHSLQIDNHDGGTWIVYDDLGSTVLQGSSAIIDVSQLPEGTYQLKTSNKLTSFVKQ